MRSIEEVSSRIAIERKNVIKQIEKRKANPRPIDAVKSEDDSDLEAEEKEKQIVLEPYKYELLSIRGKSPSAARRKWFAEYLEKINAKVVQ